MKSRTSFCNTTLLKKALHRGMPVWGIYLLSWLALFPLRMISRSDWMDAKEARRYVLDAIVVNSHILPAIYALAAACMVFGYLYKARSANFFAALPLKREAHFATNYIAGLLYALLPNLVIAVFTLLAGAIIGVSLWQEVLIWYGMSAMSYVFFFSFAALCAMLVGHLAALPILYGILNFTAVVIEAIVRSILSTFVYGLYYDGGGIFNSLSPVWHMLTESYPDVNSVWEADTIVGWTLGDWQYQVILFFVGLVFAVLAFLLRKYRRMESAGDIIAVNRLKPVFLYCFTIGCSLVIGWVLAAFLADFESSANFIPLLLCLLAGALFGFFAGQMLLHKSLRVFRKQYWFNFGVICVVITAAMLCCRLDVFGYSRYVPKAEQVLAINLDRSDLGYVDDPELIDKVIALHTDIIAQQSESEAALRKGFYNYRTIYLNYKMVGGNTVMRRYTIPIKEDANSLMRQYEVIYNDPEYLIEKSLPTGYTAENIEHAFIYIYGKEYVDEPYLTPEQAYRLLKYGVEPDIRAGALESRYWTSDGPVATTLEYLQMHLELNFRNTEDKEWDGRYVTFQFNTDCVNSLKILEELNIDLSLIETYE